MVEEEKTDFPALETRTPKATLLLRRYDTDRDSNAVVAKRDTKVLFPSLSSLEWKLMTSKRP